MSNSKSMSNSVTYDQLKNTAPEGIPKKVKKVRPIGPKNALLFFVAVMVLFIVFGSAIQYALGMIGVMITEIGFLLASVLYVKWKGLRLKDVFPVKRPKLTAVLGTLLLWMASYFLMILSDLLIMAYFPSFPTSRDVETITSGDLDWLLLFFIVAILPPICEEAMHRGVIQYGLKKKIRNPWIMALVIGLIFGIYHLDISKFLATGLLGGVMGWILFQSDNMVYSSLFHFFHNGFQMVLILIMPAIAKIPDSWISKAFSCVVQEAGSLMFNGVVPVTGQTFAAAESAFGNSQFMVVCSAGITSILFGFFVPALFYVGNYLLRRDLAVKRISLLPHDKKWRKTVLFRLIFSSLAIIATGVLTLLYGFILL